MPAALSLLIAHERKRRCWFWAAVALFYGFGWLALARHATRVAETECTIQPVRDGKCAAVHHGEDGREHGSQWDDCKKPTRWAPAPVGGTVHCWYYRTYPDYVRFAPIAVERNPPIAFALIGAGVVFIVAGLVFARRASSAAPAVASEGAPYRAPSPPDAPPASPVRIVLSGPPGFARWALALAFGPLGLLYLGVLVWSIPSKSGDVHVLDAVVVTVGLLTTYAGLAALGYRAGIDVDVARGILFHWWGLWRPLRRRYAALDALQHAEAKVFRSSKGGSFTELRITFEGRKTWTFVCEHAAAAAGALTAARDAKRHGPNPG